MDLIKHKKEENGFSRKEFKEITSQEGMLGIPLNKKPSKIKETSIEKVKERVNSENKRPRNISLPNLKKKQSNRNHLRRMKNGKRKTKEERSTKDKREKWGELFFHYF